MGMSCLDERNRVRLDIERNPDKCDYINASILSLGDLDPYVYIASQAPVSHTLGDFWQMCWEQNAHSIVMLVIPDGRRVHLWGYRHFFAYFLSM